MKTIKNILLVGLVLFFASCSEDWLELDNPNEQTSGTFWETDNDFLLGVNATYQALNYDGSFLRFTPLALDLRGDDAMSPSPWDVLQNTGSFKLFNNTIMQDWLWRSYFTGIHRSNQVLSRIEDKEFDDEALKTRLTGEAHFLRGLYYYYITTFFKIAPAFTAPQEGVNDIYPSFASNEELWSLVISDFKRAAELLPVEHTEAKDIGRATKGAALGFLGKSYLFNNEYALAAEAFEDVMELGVYDLMDNYEDNFTEEFENNKESLFEIQFDRDVGGTDLGWIWVNAQKSQTTARAITYAPTPFGWGDVAPTRWIVDEFMKEKTVDDEVDPRLQASIFYDYEGCMLYGQPFQVAYATDLSKLGCKKYSNSNSGRPDEKDWRSGINERILRYADILMMYAECKNELDDQTTCAQYIQVIRDRVNLPDREDEFAALTKEEMREVIAHERALEFVLEGHRFDDIHRWGWLKDETKLTELREHDSEFNSYVEGREYFSIPQEEMDRNPNAEQNSDIY